MSSVVVGVGSIRSAVNDIVGYSGSNDATYSIIARGIIFGSWNSAIGVPQYSKGSLRSMRKEAVCIEHVLRSAQSMLLVDDQKTVCGDMSMNKVDALLRDTRTSKSNLLPIIVRCLAPLKQDYRNDRFIRYGEQVAKHPSMVGARYHPVIDVDLDYLDNNSTIPEQVKRLFREYRILEDIAERCFR